MRPVPILLLSASLVGAVTSPADAYNPDDRCSCDSALTSVLLTESVKSNDQSAQEASSFLLFCESTFEESKDNSHFDSRGNYAKVVFDGNVNYTRDQYDQKKREVCNIQRVTSARQQVQSYLRTGPSVAAVQEAYKWWGECKRGCRAWGLSCWSSPATRQGNQTCVRVNINWFSPYKSNLAKITALSISPGLAATPANTVGSPVTQTPFLDVCIGALQTSGSVSVNVIDTLGGSDARDRCEVGILKPDGIAFGAINANQYNPPASVNVRLSDNEAKWFVESVDPDLPTHFHVASDGAPTGINSARLMMNFAASGATRIGVGVVGDDASAAAAPFNALKIIDIPPDPNPLNLASSATRRNVDLGTFAIQPGKNYVVIAAQQGRDMPRVNGFWFSY